MEINERIKSDVSGKTYIVTWVSNRVAQAEVGFARTDSEGECYFIKRLLNAKYRIPKEGKSLTTAAIERNRRLDEHYRSFLSLYKSIYSGCGETGACVPIRDYFRDGPFYYTVYSKINAESLTLKEISCLSERDKYLLLLRLVQGLQPMHSLGVIHGDLKPDNILVQKDGDSWKIRLIDMNDCYRVGNPNEPQAVVGTIDYYSPELSEYNTYDVEDWEDEEEMRKVDEMAKSLTLSSDIFALGIIFHEFYTGHRPLILDDDVFYICEAVKRKKLALSSELPDDLSMLIQSMLDVDYTKRPTLSQVGNALRTKLVGVCVADPCFSIIHLKDDIYQLEILNDDPEVEIYYTIDGTVPSRSSSLYSGPLNLKKYTIVKAICFKGSRRSCVVSQSAWVKTQPFTVSKSPRIIVHDKDVTILLDERSPKSSIIYYTLDGSVPTKESFIYTESLHVGNEVEVVKAMVVESGSKVKHSEVISAKVYRTKKILPPIIKKTFKKNEFSIISNNGHCIYYTLDGSYPTIESEIYTSEFSVSDIDSFHIRAICFEDGIYSDVVELQNSKSTVKMKFKTK